MSSEQRHSEAHRRIERIESQSAFMEVGRLMAYEYAGSKTKRRSPKLEATLAKLLQYEQAQNIAELLDENDTQDGPPGHPLVLTFRVKAHA